MAIFRRWLNIYASISPSRAVEIVQHPSGLTAGLMTAMLAF